MEQTNTPQQPSRKKAILSLLVLLALTWVLVFIFSSHWAEISTALAQLSFWQVLLVLAIGLSLFLYKTRVGLMLRAVSQDKMAASLVAINVKKVTLIGNIVGTGLGGIAGLLYGTYLTNVSTVFGTVVGLKAISACVLGGMTNIPGAALGALLIGILENFGIALFTSSYRDIIGFLVVFIALSFRPEGLFVFDFTKGFKRKGGK